MRAALPSPSILSCASDVSVVHLSTSVDDLDEFLTTNPGEGTLLHRKISSKSNYLFIQEMARRVMELEQEASELRKIADRRQDHPSAVDPAALPAHASDEVSR